MKTLKKAALAMAVVWSAGFAHAVELNFWSFRVEDKAFYDQIAKDYKKISGDDVKFQPYKNTEYPAVLSAALASGAGPDIIHTRAYGGLSNLSDAGYLVPVSAKTIPALAKFNSHALDGARGYKDPFNKDYFGVPATSQSLGIMVNKAILEKNGVTEMPKTWDEFKALCKTLKSKGVTPLANGSKDAPILEQMFGVVGPNFYGGTEYFNDVKSGKRNFNDAGFVKAIEETVALKEFMPPNAMGIGENESRSLFAMGGAAFFMTGTWNIDTVKELNTKIELDMVAAPPLKAGAKPYMATFADANYSINANSKNKDAALKFLNYLASKEYGQKLVDELRQPSAVPDTRSTDKVVNNVGEQTQKYGTPFLMLVGFRYQNPNGSVLLRDGMQKLVQGNGTAQQLAADIQTGLATWHKPFQK